MMTSAWGTIHPARVVMLAGSVLRLRKAMEFFEKVDEIATPTGIVDLFNQQVTVFGYQTAIITGLPRAGERFDEKVLTKHWPAEWYRTYVAKGYVAHDPVARMCRRTNVPFLWNDAPYDKTSEPRAHAIMQQACDFHMNNGLCIPIYGTMGFEVCISLGAEHIAEEIWQQSTIQLVSFMTYIRLQQLGAPCKQAFILSNREREVMQWTAAGKSAWEVGCILSISENTVNKHIVNALRKLNATNKTQGVAHAILLREIDM